MTLPIVQIYSAMRNGLLDLNEKLKIKEVCIGYSKLTDDKSELDIAKFHWVQFQKHGHNTR